MTLFENELAKGIMSIIETHFGGIKIKEEDAIFYAKELAPQILPYAQKAKEQKFHNERKAFYIDSGEIVWINKGLSHKEYFKSINHPEYINRRIRGYVLNDHILFYIGEEFRIPNIDMKSLYLLSKTIQVETGNLIKWIGLGCIEGEVGEEWKPMFKITLDLSIEI